MYWEQNLKNNQRRLEFTTWPASFVLSLFDWHEAPASVDTSAYKRQKQQTCIFHERVREMSHVLEQGRFIISLSRRNVVAAAPVTAPRWEGQQQRLPFRGRFIQSEEAGIFPPRPAPLLSTKITCSYLRKGKKMRTMENLSSPNRPLKTKGQHVESGRACSPCPPLHVHRWWKSPKAAFGSWSTSKLM